MTTSSFDVLSKDISVYRSRVVEASAGTGKTFAIENLVLRLLIEDDPATGEPLLLEQILAVTFTRAATRDLKKRIQANLNKAWKWLTKSSSMDAPPFLQALHEQGAEACQKAARRVEHALAAFDQAQIFTIHGFCARMLVEYDLNALAGHTDEQLSTRLLLRIVKDFLRTEVRAELISPFQLKAVLGSFQADEEVFQRKLLEQAIKPLLITPPEDFSVHLTRFQESMVRLKRKGWTAANLLADWKVILGRVKDKEEVRASGEQWINQLAKDQWTAADFETFLANERLMDKVFGTAPPKVKAGLLNYPEWAEVVREELLSTVREVSDSNRIFACLASHCQRLINKVLQEEEIRGADRLLSGMVLAVQEPLFVQQVRQRYRAAVVDEFQDTDPQQWSILEALFPQDGDTYLTVVGDPKQSIYAFRQADIYTYRQAAQTFAQQGRLSTNYRSQPGLVAALNVLFDCPGFMALPRTNTYLDPGAVKASPQAVNHPFHDQRKALHFLIAKGTVSSQARSFPNAEFEQQYLFPSIAQEMSRLHLLEGFCWNQMAVLVRDRSQGKAFLEYLKLWNIPTATQRSNSLVDSEILPAMIELLQGFLDPRDKSPLKCVLGGVLVGWRAERLREWTEDYLANKEQLLVQAQRLHQILLEDGFEPFMESFLRSSWSGETVLEGLLRREDGRGLYRDLRQLSELMSQQQTQQHLSIQGLLQWLLNLQETVSDEDDEFKVWDDPALDAVRIMTIHYSKGLEFDIVFTLGLIRRDPNKDSLISIGQRLEVAVVGSAALELHQREGDAEKARLAYVALTRAKVRVYVPVAIGEKLTAGQQAKPGEASAMELLMARLGQPPMDEQALYERINHEDREKQLTAFLDCHRDLFSYEKTAEKIAVEPLLPEKVPLLTEPLAWEPLFSPFLMHSYTSMAHKTAVEERYATVAPRDYNNPVKSVHTLPAGKEIGIALHQIFERMPFHSVRSYKDVESYVPSWLQDWGPVMGSLVYQTLHTPLPLLTGPFALHYLFPSNKLIEWEFMIPTQDGLIKGFVDLIFEHQGFYYLVDWKSNWLGPNAAAYTDTYLEAAMLAENYDLQLQIYTEALRCYLEKTDPRPFKDCFGGAFYLFSRGMGEGQNGIYYARDFFGHAGAFPILGQQVATTM